MIDKPKVQIRKYFISKIKSIKFLLEKKTFSKFIRIKSLKIANNNLQQNKECENSLYLRTFLIRKKSYNKVASNAIVMRKVINIPYP